MKDKVKIFDYAWHIPHQSDMLYALKDDCDFFYCLNLKTDWDLSKRAMPSNLRFVTHYEPGKYDLAILHVDQSSSTLNHKRIIYEQFNELIVDIPKVVINHGSPIFPEAFPDKEMSSQEMKDLCVSSIKKMIGSNCMVVNSHTAASQKEWGFGIPIVHGMSHNDWIDLPKEPRVFSALSRFGMNEYYNRNCLLAVAKYLDEKFGYILAYANANVDLNSSFEEYRSYLGKSLLYLDTSFRTPMNRARTEAMLSGCCVIQVEGAHDLDLWARDGENIIIVPNNYKVISEVIIDLLENNYKRAIAIGMNGKKTAIEYFSPERYRKDWLKVINSLVPKSSFTQNA